MTALTWRQRGRMTALAVAAALVMAGCTVNTAGRAVPVGAAAGTQSQDLVPDGPNGLRADAVIPKAIVVEGASDSTYDRQATATLADLFEYYESIFPTDFGRKFTPPMAMHSYDSTVADTLCGVPTLDYHNAFYARSCDLIAFDRGVLLPELDRTVGPIAAPTIIAHEVGHLVQERLGVLSGSSSMLLEQQADCYAGAYWRWVADGHSSRFDISQGAGVRQMLAALQFAADPIGLPASTSQAHGSAFDRSVAAVLGFTEGAQRCRQIDQAEVDRRITQTGFTVLPKNFSNIPITEEFIAEVTETLKSYFTQAVPNFQPPTVQSFTGTPPPCPQTATTDPVFWCQADNTIYYDLNRLIQIGTPEATWASTNGDFSAVILLASRYALAAQATGGAPVTGDQVGLRSLCYAGTWASWMKTPKGDRSLMLSPNDLDKSAYEVIRSPLAASDIVGKTSVQVIHQLQALHIGVTTDISQCFQMYGSVT